MAKKSNQDAAEILADAKAGRIEPLYLFYGEEDFYIDRLAGYFEDQVLQPGEKAFNQTILYGRDTSARQILECCSRPPMMAPKQVVIIREAQDLKDKEYESLEAYFNKPFSHALLIFCYKHGKPDMRKKAFKSLAANGVVYESKKLSDYQIEGWIQKHAAEEGLKLNQDAVLMLAESCGPNMSTIHNELSKLRLILEKPGQTITGEMVEEYIGISRDYTGFEYAKAWANRDVSKGFRIAKHFSENEKEVPLIMLNSLMYNYFQKVHLCMLNKKMNDAELASKIGVMPFLVREYRKAADGLNSARIGDIFQLLNEFDSRAKGIGQGGGNDSELVMEFTFRLFQISGANDL